MSSPERFLESREFLVPPDAKLRDVAAESDGFPPPRGSCVLNSVNEARLRKGKPTVSERSSLEEPHTRPTT